jgi:hypothetical protein
MSSSLSEVAGEDVAVLSDAELADDIGVAGVAAGSGDEVGGRLT